LFISLHSNKNDLTDTITELKKITSILLDKTSDYSAILNACSSLKDLFYTATGFDDSLQLYEKKIVTGAGHAIGPVQAALCITDMMRTRVFLMGICDAIEKQLTMNPGKPVVVMYAGTGPFATLLTPLTTVFSASQLKMVLLEINFVSKDYLEKTIRCFAMQEYVSDVIIADATTYKVPDNYIPDIIVSETMKPALKDEPQVNIVANLLSQFPHALLIPESIKVSAALMGNIADADFSMKHLHDLLEVSARTMIPLNDQKNNMTVFSEGVMVEIPEYPGRDLSTLVLDTEVTVFNGHILHFNECGLTIPVKVMDLASTAEWPLKLNFRYERKPLPGFIIQKL